MQRPAIANVFGILNIIFGGVGFLGALLNSLNLNTAAAARNPIMKSVVENPTYTQFIKISVPLGVLAGICLVVSGIGLLKVANWGRKLAIGYGIYAIAFAVMSMSVLYVVMVAPMIEKASHAEGPDKVILIFAAVGGLLGGAFSLVYPTLLIIFMTRPKTVAAFRGAATPPDLPRY